ncbi:hypothetical protein [Streptomyces sp. NPDC096012]|uniref:hypothetical protein n=1 Tax=Streptomyces sp. NPDC096012 TaxID=3155684 RepID=UPI003369D9CD
MSTVTRWPSEPRRRWGLVPLTDAELRDVVKNEEMAEFLLSVQDPVAMAAHLNNFTGAEKLAEVKKIAAYKKEVFRD